MTLFFRSERRNFQLHTVRNSMNLWTAPSTKFLLILKMGKTEKPRSVTNMKL